MKIHTIPQLSEDWHRLRIGIPTASEFSRIVTSTGAESKSRHGYAMQLAAELYAGEDLNRWGGNLSTDRGRFLEEDGLRQYAFEQDAEIVPVGFITDDDGTHGCSPDSLVGDDGCAEVKCVNAEKHTATIWRYRQDGSIPPEFTQQTQGQLLITGRAWCDLVFYHPKLPVLVVRQFPIPAVHSGLLDGIAALIEERDEILSALRAQRDGTDSPRRVKSAKATTAKDTADTKAAQRANAAVIDELEAALPH